MATSSTIEVARYTAAFRTWIDVATRTPQQASSRDRQRAIVEEYARWVETEFSGSVDIESVCAAIRERAARRGDTRELPFADKSCLLWRLTYGGEELRTRPCPIHDGHWSGLGDCPAGCCYGDNITGWLPNALVDDVWPGAPSVIEGPLEATLRADFDRDALAVYADRLQVAGDPRGELIAIDLAARATPELAARRTELAAAWLGALAQPSFAVRDGFVVATLSAPEHVRLVFDAPAGRFIRWLAIDADDQATREIVRFLAVRRHVWLAELTVTSTTLEPLELSGIRAQTRPV